MKGVSLISGGKDSFLSLLIALSIGMEIESTITVNAETDSTMFHFPNAKMGREISSMFGIENSIIQEHEFQETLMRFKGYFLVAGAVESEFQKTRIEAMCESYGLIPFLPLWRRNNESILMEIIESNIDTIFVSVAAEGLDEGMLGRRIDPETLEILKNLKRRYGVSMVGEGGEYETLVLGSPFNPTRIHILESRIVDRGIQKNLEILKYELVRSV
jgi:diphthine-ammonia ligase